MAERELQGISFVNERKRGLQEEPSSLCLKNGCISGCDRIGSGKYGTGDKERGLGLKVKLGSYSFIHSFIDLRSDT